MRVITGTARGRRLLLPECVAIRPTPEKVKEAVFSTVQFDVAGSLFLDLFAGSGQMGIEALSRGAESCCFCDVSAAAVKLIRRNATVCGFSERARVFQCDYTSCLRCCEKVNIAFLDPPYLSGLLVPALLSVVEKVEKSGVVFCEHPEEEKLPRIAGKFECCAFKRYGKVCVSVYRAAGERA